MTVNGSIYDAGSYVAHGSKDEDDPFWIGIVLSSRVDCDGVRLKLTTHWPQEKGNIYNSMKTTAFNASTRKYVGHGFGKYRRTVSFSALSVFA